MKLLNQIIAIASRLRILWRLVGYNLKIVFARKFIYFLASAIVFFIFAAAVNLVSNRDLNPAPLYNILLLPGLLLVLYPSCFGIQNDAEAQMIEIIFGIPDYRYKVWLFRLLLTFALTGCVMLSLCLMCALVSFQFPALQIFFHVMFPIVFLGSLAFLLSTLMRNAYGAMVVVLLIGIAFWMLGGSLAASAWNVFLNPFAIPAGAKQAVWAATVRSSRIMLAAAALTAIVWGMGNLSKREKFI